MSTRQNALPSKIADALRKHFSENTIIDVSPSGVRDNLHVLVVSTTLDGKTEQQKQEYLWGILDEAVKNKQFTKAELRRVSLVLPVSVDELRR